MAKDKSYSEKLRDPRWQRFRLEVMQRDDFKCIRCNSGGIFLHIHHTVYKKCDPWDYPIDLMETLCEICHYIKHKEIAPANPEWADQIIIISKDEKSFLTATQTHIDILMATLRNGVPADLEEEILKTILYLQETRKEHLNG